MKNITRLVLSLLMLIFISCDRNPEPDKPVLTGYAKGADIGWLTEMENAGKKFYDSQGREKDCFVLLKELGVNAIRLRVWVNPADGWCNMQDLINKAKRANDLGLRIMINFHYSDSWADPSKQNKPTAWSSMTFDNLKKAVSKHTNDVLQALRQSNIKPEWIQIGNETGNGMLWEDGKASVNMSQYVALNNAGYDAAKSVFPEAKIVVHIQEGNNNTLFRWIFDGFVQYGGKWDVIGMSLYPEPSNWQQMVSVCVNNMKDMIRRYNKDVMICEVGMSWDQSAACNSFLTQFISETKAISDNRCLGFFYWEPECYGNWKGYTKGAFDNSGKPTAAMDAFK